MSNINEILKFDPDTFSNKDDIQSILQFDPKPQESPDLLPSHQKEEDSLTWKDAIVEGMQNIPSSAWSFAKDMATPVLHPKETGKALWSLAKGTAEKLTPGIQEDEKYFDAMVDFYKSRYGSTEGFKNAIAKDPVGVLADVASIVSGAGAAVKIGAKAAGLSSKVALAAKNIERVGVAMEPVNLAKRIVTSPLKLIPESVPNKMYQSAVKFGTTLSMKERKAVTNTALINQIMPTEKGMKKLVSMIDDYNEKVNSAINKAPYKGHPISVKSLYSGLDTLKNEFKRISDEPQVWDAAFNRLRKSIKESVEVGPARSLQETQKIKTRIYRELKSFYEKQTATPARVELRKAVARNARESLESFIPEIKNLNKNEGALIELWDAIESKANRITNRDLIGLGLPVKMGTGAGVGNMIGGTAGASIGTGIGFTLGIYDTPQVKAKLALVINKLSQKGIEVKPTPTLMRLGLFQAARPEHFKEEPETMKSY